MAFNAFTTAQGSVIRGTKNTLRHNKDHGVFYELSSKGVIAGNVIVGHPTYGIRISGATT